MTFGNVGAAHFTDVSGTFSLTPGGAGNFILLTVIIDSPSQWATALSGSNVSWSVLVSHAVLSTNGVTETVFLGQVTSTSAANQTITVNTGSGARRIGWQEFSATHGFAAVTLDASGTVDTNAGGTFPSLTPAHGAGELYYSFAWDNGTGTAGSTSGYTYTVDPAHGNIMTYNASCGTGAQAPNFGDSGTDGISGIAVLLYEAVTSVSGAAALSGSGTLTASGQVVVPAAASLTGTGTLAGTPVVAIPASAVLLGAGSLTAAADVTEPGGVSAGLSGSGTLSVARSAGLAQAAALSGSGTLTAQYTGLILQAAALSGSGVLSAATAEALKFTAGLFGAGFLSIPQVAGGLVNGVGGVATPMALPGSSQVAVAPPGSGNWQWLGTLGQVTALTYSYVCPGGADKMTCTILVPASFQTQLFYPGWQVKVVRGGHDVWHGKIDEAQFQAGQGWALTAVGNGNRGQDYNAYFAIAWPGSEPDEIINRAIIRGLPWVNPGYNSAPFASQFWFGQSVDAGAQKVSDFLNLICSRGGLTWYVNSQPGGLYGADDLQIFPLPTTPTCLLVSTNPVPRTLGGYTNYILIKYQSNGDSAGATAATYAYVAATNPQSIAAHGQLEAYLDLSDAGVQTAAQAQAVGQYILSVYVAASWAGPFTVSPGQLLNPGGQAMDLGTCQAGGMAKLVLADSAYGGSVEVNEPVTFIIGSYSYNDMTQVAQISPLVTLDQSLSGLMNIENQILKPVTAASA